VSAADATRLADVDAALDGAARLPRDNGELVFEEPWQGRALAMGVVLLERLEVPWAEFRRHLVEAIASHHSGDTETAATTYYTAWLDALEKLLAGRNLDRRHQPGA
jgi:nitrile hydratase accessory protein